MRKIAEMVRASWRIARSYKLNLAFSILALFFTTLPFYFAAHAMQPMMGKVVQQEGGDYFCFVLLGLKEDGTFEDEWAFHLKVVPE